MVQPGDFLLEKNEYLRVGIIGPRNSLGPGMYGGSLVDADLQWSNPQSLKFGGRDQFAELFPMANMNVTRPIEATDVRVLEDGSDGGPAIIRAEGNSEPFVTLLGALWALVGAPDFVMQTDYVVEPKKPWVTIRTRVGFGVEYDADMSDAPEIGYYQGELPLLDWAINSGIVLGDFYLSGGHINVFAPGIGFDEEGAVFDVMSDGVNMFSIPSSSSLWLAWAMASATALHQKRAMALFPCLPRHRRRSWGAQDGDGTNQRFADGTLEYERYYVGHGDIGSIVDSYVEAREIPYGTVSGHVLERHTGDAVTDIDVFVYRRGESKPWSQWRTDVHPEDEQPDGSFSGRFASRRLGVEGARSRTSARGGRGAVGYRGRRNYGEPRGTTCGVFTFEVEDEAGDWIPSKVSIFRVDDEPSRDPVLGDGFIAGSPETVVFAAYGEGEVELAPGTYYAVASRGLEYEIDISEPFEIDRINAHHAQFQVVRSVETDGWISADFHVHAAPSHDSGVALADRVRTMVCEGVEFFSSTDHDFMTDYAPTVELLGLEDWVQTAVGLETTTVEIGHFLSFPLESDFLAEAGGAFDWTDLTPSEILDEIEDQGVSAGYEPMTFIGHPRDGILGYFDQYGFSPYKGTPGLKGAPGETVIETPILR